MPTPMPLPAPAPKPRSLSLSRFRFRSVSGRASPGRRSAIVPPNDSSSTCALPLPSVSVSRLLRRSLLLLSAGSWNVERMPPL
jgi:hypothetical protein